MGIESVSYRFELDGVGSQAMDEWLSEHYAEPGNRPGAYAIADDRSWVDLFVLFEDEVAERVDVRMAVTHLPSAVGVLHQLLIDLFDRFPGRLKDGSSRHVLRNDSELLDYLATEFGRRRERFTAQFGELDLPVSADVVFSRLRELFG